MHFPLCVIFAPNSGYIARYARDSMYVTYQDLIQIGIRIVALANLFYQIYKGRLFDRLRFIKSGCYFLDLCVY